jgi:thiamine-phosphate pyrophosphorylase
VVSSSFSFAVKTYPLTDVRLSGLSHAEQVAKLSEAGASLIQLREKHLSAGEFYKQAEEALRVGRQRGARIIINDRVDIALALGADGVHLGQEDIPPEAVRQLLGDSVIIGFSTHSVEQALRAAASPVDYLAIGPIFATSSKSNPDPEIGLEGLRRVRKAVGNIQLVAIGGISLQNVSRVLAAGADAVAVITAVLNHPEVFINRTKEAFIHP